LKEYIKVIMCSFTVFIIMLGLGIIAPIFPIFVKSKGVPVYLVGIIIATYAIVQFVLLSPFGMLSDRYGRKKFIIGGLAGYSVTTLLYTFSDNILQLFLVRILHGLSSAFVFASAQAMVAELAPLGKRGAAMGIFIAMLMGGMGAGFMLGGILADVISLHAPFYACSILAFIAMVYGVFELEETVQIGKGMRPRKISLKLPIVSRGILVAAIFTFVVSLGYGSLGPMYPLFAVEVAHMSSSAYGIILGVNILVFTAVLPFAGSVSDKVGRKIPITIGTVVYAVSFIFLTFSVDFYYQLMMLAINSLGLGFANPAVTAIMADLAPREHMGAVMGFSNMARTSGEGILGPIFGGAIINIFGLSLSGASALFIICGILGLIAMIPVILLRKTIAESENSKMSHVY
jgi:DHA1 family multidrug resistance protein-like MFS transporter